MRNRRWLTVVALAVVAAAFGIGSDLGNRSALADVARAAMFANLDGSSEVGPDGKRGAGDPDGWGGAVVTIEGTQLCFGLTVHRIGTPTGAHIHVGNPSQAGPVAVPLAAPTSGDPGSSSGCTSVPADVAAAIVAHPRGYYINVHTQEFPDGAIRGQLTPPNKR
jgi:hypothetical protein